ncbi:MAG TPA: hemolysin family protein [Steroidobacteraceae bacterium]|nr:hemolysin family protein [Steroidobacteraceae bacterium]
MRAAAVIFGLIVLNGLFASAELALVSARRSRLKALAEGGHRGARAALNLLSDPTRLLSSVQVGITLVGILTGLYSGAAYSARLAAWLIGLEPRLAPYAEGLASGLIVVVMTYFSIVLGELVPKRLALTYADRWAVVVALPMQFIARFGAPVVWMLQRSTDALVKLLPTETRQSEVTDDDVRALAAEGMQTGALHRHEAEMIDSVLRLADRSIESIMVPRGDILWLDANEPVATLWDEARRSGHARFLLCRGELEQLLGVVSLANLGEALRRGQLDLDADVQAPLHVPESISVFKLLETFRRSSVHLGVVTNEYGGIEGLVTPADILKAIAGDLPDMGSRDAAGAQPREDGSWLIDGHLSIHEAERALNRKDLARGDNYNTMAGFVLWHLGRLPVPGEKLAWRDLSIEVIDMDGLVIDKLLVQPRSAQGLRAGEVGRGAAEVE